MVEYGRRWRILVGALCLVVVLAAPARAQDDTWTDVERIVAVGDIHGDFEQAVRVLRAAKVIDEKHTWSAGKTHLVQIGDVPGRGRDSTKVMNLLMKLEKEAADAGGMVHALIGNHEAMVLLNDWRYVNPDEIAAFGGAAELRQAMSAEGKYGRWIRGHNTVIKINDVLFVHAGITAETAKLTLAEINNTVRDELAKGKNNGLAMSESGPLWDRTIAREKGENYANDLDAALKKYDVQRMVIGHTVFLDGIHVQAGGKVICIDVGMTAVYGGQARCLVIQRGKYQEVIHDKPARPLDVPAPATQPSSDQKRKAA